MKTCLIFGGKKYRVNLGGEVLTVMNEWPQWSLPKIPTVGLAYEISEDGTYAICSSVGTAVDNDILIASSYNGLPVTHIANSAFENCDSLTSITIPSSITSIGFAAFDNCNNLDNITVVTNNPVFKSIDGNLYVQDDSLLMLSKYAVGKTDEVFTFPDNVTMIGSGAFLGCDNLRSVSIPDSVISISERAFEGCRGLTEVIIQDSVINIGSGIFEGCNNLTKIYYQGTENNWKTINIDSNNSVLTDNVYYYTEIRPLKEGKYWHYNENGEIEIWAPVVASEGLVYTPNDDGESCTLTEIGECTDTDIIIPAKHDGLKVTSIAANAFKNRDNLTSVRISDFVTSIGNSAFYDCGNLTSVTIPSSVTSIGSSAFYWCDKLTSIEIPDSVTSIGNSAFYNCTSLTEIKYNAIECADLTSNNKVFYNAGKSGTGINVTIGTSVKKIPAYLFYPQERSGMNLLYYAPKIVSITFEAESMCESIGNYALFDCTSLTDIVIPDSVTSIGNYAFRNCSGLSSITLGNSVTMIGSYAFYYCSSLTSIVIPDKVTSIGGSAFYNCYTLVEVINKSTHITVTKGSTSNGYVGYYAFAVYNSGNTVETKLSNDNGYIIYTDSNEKILVGYNGTETALILPAYTTKINQYAFYDRTSLTSIEIPNSVTSIGYRAFENCTSLTSIEIPDSVTSIGGSAFSSCDNLMSVVIGDGVTSIGSSAFAYCDSLESVTLGNNVETIGTSAFNQCSNLISIDIPSSVTDIKDQVFAYCNSLTSIIVDEANSKYSSLDGSLYNKNQTQLIQYAAGKTTTEFIIPDSVTSIGGYAFLNCKLTNIILPNTLTSIGEYAFDGCKNLPSIFIPRSVTSVSENAFTYGTSITVYCEAESKPSGWNYSWIQGSNTVVWGYKPATPASAFERTNDGTSVTITKYIDEGTDVVIPSTLDGLPVTTIGAAAFKDCANLTSVEIPDSVTTINKNAFYGCSGLTSIEIPDSVTTINERAFAYCTGLTRVDIPSSVTYVGSYAFDGCRDSKTYSTDYLKVYYISSTGWHSQWNYSTIGSKRISMVYAGGDVGGDGSTMAKAYIAKVGSNSGVIKSSFAYFKFVPTATRTYTIQSSGSYDYVGTLYTGSPTSYRQLTTDDDSGGNRQFKISYTLNSGQTYYIAVRTYSSTSNAAVTVVIS